MEQQGDQLDREKVICSICLDLLKNPVIIPCGHSYCMNCVEGHWNAEDQRESYSCPQCRETFRPRPALVKNIILADLVEDLNKAELQAAPANSCYAGPKDVACDFCTGRKRKANKSCLQCLASYCEQHLQPHYKVVPLKKHKLVEASATLQDSICSLHDQLKMIFCRTDKQIICSICALRQHKGHDKVVAEAEITKRQEGIRSSRQKIQQRIQDQKTEVNLLENNLQTIENCAEQTVKDSKKSTELVQLIERISTDVESKIRSLQEFEMTRGKEHQEQLLQEIAELKEKDTELKKLLRTKDKTEFLHKYPSLSCLGKSTNSPSIVLPVLYFEKVSTAMSEVKDELQESYNKEWKKLSRTVNLQPHEPKTKAELLQYAFQKNSLQLDPNTANMRMVLSEENRKAALARDEQSYSSSSSRFVDKSQVLSVQSLTGRCYFEVQWSGMSVSVAVAYKDIARSGGGSLFGHNDKSWVLECTHRGYTFKHNCNRKHISEPLSSKVGVFLDHRAGFLSFYSISEGIALLHRVKTTFTQPLFAGLGVYFFGSSAEFCDIY